MRGRLTDRTIALCVTGSIAAYKSVEVARILRKAGARVIPVMTESAKRFLGEVTLSGITGEPVRSSMWDPSYPGEMHIDIGAEADVIAIVPATADVLARLAQGRADDLVTALALSGKGRVLAAPAMHPRMWDHPATRRNVELLREMGAVGCVGPVYGPVASGDEGVGRMAEPESIADAIEAALAPKDLIGRRLLVSAGPTVEDIDPVRFLSNRSTGKMGFAICARAIARGADVTLVTGPTQLRATDGVRRVDVRGAVAMRGALWQAAGVDLGRIDALIMSAAVSDYRPADVSATKLKKEGDRSEIALVKNPDLLAELGHARPGLMPVLIGFAVETGDEASIVNYARGKLAAKRVDLIVANDARDAFGHDDNRVVMVSHDDVESLEVQSKLDIADRILDRVRDWIAVRTDGSRTRVYDRAALGAEETTDAN